MKNDITWKRIYLYVGITFLITYLVGFFVIGPMVKDPMQAPYVSMITACVMFIPAIGSIFTRIFTKEGLKNFGIRADFKNTKKYYVLAWFGPSALIIVGSVLYYLIYPNHFDANMTYMVETYTASGLSVTSEQLKGVLFQQVIMGVLLSPALNIFFCLGEELGWRGYLLPKLSSKMKIVPTLLISGIIWGLWHAPLTYLAGHNYGFGYWGYPFTGILAMCGFCIVIGVFLSYLTIKTNSCLAATFAHGALNGFASIGLFFAASETAFNPFIGPAPTGIIGGMGFIVVAIIMVVLLVKNEKQAQ